MPRACIIRESKVVHSPRVSQIEGIFDIARSEKSREQWNVSLDLPEVWNVGLIVGPSGSGKTTIIRELFGEHIVSNWEWPTDKSVLDGFPVGLSIKEIVKLLSSVGFSSPPLWIRPFHVLSNGEQFRVNLARLLAENMELSVMDEFTSVVDRTVAQIGSAALQKVIRDTNRKFIAASCHYDIIDWLEPDWVYQPHTQEFYVGRYLHQRPKIELKVQRVHHSAWTLFRKYHYLDTELNKSAICFVAFWRDVPVAFTAVLHFPHAKARNIKREHRTVCLPDYQGVGIGNAVSDYIASLFAGLGYRYVSSTGNPAMVRSRAKSKNWKMTRALDRTPVGGSNAIMRDSMASNRFTASFEYVGPKLDRNEAARIIRT